MIDATIKYYNWFKATEHQRPPYYKMKKGDSVWGGRASFIITSNTVGWFWCEEMAKIGLVELKDNIWVFTEAAPIYFETLIDL